MKKYLGALFVVELVAVIFGIGVMFVVAINAMGAMGVVFALLLAIVFIAPVVILYAVLNLLDRVEILEDKLLKKKVLTKKDLETPVKEDIIWENENSKLQPTFKGKIIADEEVELCKNCGYQMFPEDTECPNCHTKRNK